MYTREAERKLGSLNGSACLYEVPTVPSAEGMCEEYGHLYPEYRSEGSQRISRELRIRSGGADWESEAGAPATEMAVFAGAFFWSEILDRVGVTSGLQMTQFGNAGTVG
jgi:hypothetical protein